ncbi:MAG: ornithine--oxo-acid transaminase [Betaproteobacteria bacterium]|nr:ornithine--oxo-acid transaminase [Betaproteobacteria bacterium]
MSNLRLVSPRIAKPVEIVGVACGEGAQDKRCSGGPDALREGDLLCRLQACGLSPAWNETIRPAHTADDDPIHLVKNICERLAWRVHSIVAQGRLPVVVGGDHTCAIGTWNGVASALRPRGSLGLIWIDAHMDAHTPQTTPSGALHGMPLACLLGFGDGKLTELANGARLSPRHVCLIGVRSFEAGEAALLRELGVRVFFQDEVSRRGLDTVMREALAIVQEGTAGFGVTLDLDAIDPNEAPGVTTRVPGGLGASELVSAAGLLQGHPALAGVEIAEYNPLRDRHGATAQVACDLLQSILAGEPPASGALSLTEIENLYGAHNYLPLPVVLTRGQGAYLWDDHGRRYLDMMSAYSAVSHGHCHPRLLEALTTQAQRLAVTSRAYYNDRLPLFLKRLCEISGQDLALPVNTGLEAVETAIKAARKWGYKVKGVPADRVEIIACDGNFHGRSTAIIAMSSEQQYRDGFGPYPAGFVRIPYGDPQALERAITPNTAAFLVEPIQGEAGIVVPPRGYLSACAEICRHHGVLLICDEVQTGLGRTGRMFACEDEAVKPDGLILGKALGGGLLPVSAFLARRDVLEVFTPGDHGSTFGGNPLASAVGLAAIDVLIEERLVQRAADLGDYLLRELRALKSPLIREVRGRGLLIGVDIDPARASAREVCESLLRHGVLSKDTHHTVVRLAPPLVIVREQIDDALAALRATLAELDAAVDRAA